MLPSATSYSVWMTNPSTISLQSILKISQELILSINCVNWKFTAIPKET